MLHTKACLSLAVALLARTANAGLATACWRMVESQVVSFQGVPCGIVTSDSPVVPCCNTGSYCLSNSICLTPGIPNLATGFTNYYTAGCTDLSYDSLSCNPYCRDLWRADIVYNNVSQIWSCCGTESDNNTVNCNSPTKEIFDDPAPSDLSMTFSAGTAAVTSTATTSSSTSTPVQTTSSSTSFAATTSSGSSSQTSASQSSTSLSTGAKAGIGIGVALGVIAVFVGGILLLRRRQRSRTSPGNGHEPKAPPQELGVEQQQKRAELFSEPRVHELS